MSRLYCSFLGPPNHLSEWIKGLAEPGGQLSPRFCWNYRTRDDILSVSIMLCGTNLRTYVPLSLSGGMSCIPDANLYSLQLLRCAATTCGRWCSSSSSSCGWCGGGGGHSRLAANTCRGGGGHLANFFYLANP